MKEPAPMDSMAREETIFHAAIQLHDAAKRSLYLEMACEGNGDLRARIEKLILADSGDIPSGPRLAKRELLGPESVGSGTVSGQPEPEATGERIGRYKLLQKIGEGGCGVVYMAEQEEPVRRRVALKIIKLGMDTKSVIARFEAERQALALMDHPNIAKVLDAGSTENGRPYFVMELVRGTKMTDYCDEKQLSTRERLELFSQVCHAIQHAHQKGIIHRDIKPSNVLITVNDGVALPKVIDFGIAKATTDQRLTDKTVFTAFEQFIGTPAYMSPEQAEITSVDVDTRSDIYSLGVLLYELLTGKTPFDSKELLQAGLDAMRRTIREKEPARPSYRVGTLGAEELTTTAKRRGLEPPKLVNVLRGDLDWIVMKCLEKDRARRYETANGLAHDIARHLAQQPVTACPPSNFYRFGKLVRRNKLAFVAASVVLASLLIGFGISTWMYFQERAAKREQARLRLQAQTKEKKAQEIAQFLQAMLKGVGPSVAMGQDTTLLKEILDKTSQSVGKDLINEPEVEVELRTTLAEAYLELGLYQEAENSAQAAVNRARASLGEENLALARSLQVLGRAQWNLPNQLDKPEKSVRQALALRRKLAGNQDPSVAESLDTLAFFLMGTGHEEEAEAAAREALALRQKVFGPEHPLVAQSLQTMANVLAKDNKAREALPYARQALALDRKLLGNEHYDTADALLKLASVFQALGELPQAEAALREGLPIQRKLFAQHPLRLASSLDILGSFLRDQGKLEEAEATLREGLELKRKQLDDGDPDVLDSLLGLADVLQRRGNLEGVAQLRVDAERAAERGKAVSQFQLGGAYHVGWGVEKSTARAVLWYRKAADQNYVPAQNNLGAMYFNGDGVPRDLVEGLQWYHKAAEQGDGMAQKNLANLYLHGAAGVPRDTAEGLKWCRKIAESGYPRDLNDLAWLLATCDDSRVRDGSNAVSIAERAVAQTNRKDPQILDTLAAAYAEAGQFAKAASTQSEAMALRQVESAKAYYAVRLKLYQAKIPYREIDLDTVRNCAQALKSEGKLPEAESCIRQALETQRRQFGDGHPETVALMIYFIHFQRQEGKHEEAERFSQEILAPALKGSLQPALLSRRADLLARAGHWGLAAADLMQSIHLQPSEHHYHPLAPLLVASGDLAGYRRDCQEAAARFGQTDDPGVAERMAKDCLMVGDSGLDMQIIAKWADTAVTVRTNVQQDDYWRVLLPWSQLCKGLAEYRQSRYASALDWAQKVLAAAGQFPERDVQAWMILAMAHYRLGSPDQARSSLAKGAEIAETKLPKLDSGDVGRLWNEWLYAQTLMHQARELIEGQTPVAAARNPEPNVRNQSKHSKPSEPATVNHQTGSE